MARSCCCGLIIDGDSVVGLKSSERQDFIRPCPAVDKRSGEASLVQLTLGGRGITLVTITPQYFMNILCCLVRLFDVLDGLFVCRPVASRSAASRFSFRVLRYVPLRPDPRGPTPHYATLYLSPLWFQLEWFGCIHRPSLLLLLLSLLYAMVVFAQDNLALFFVDMRSTVLVSAADASSVLEELCLSTEAFEKAEGSARPGEVIVCAPQVRPIMLSWFEHMWNNESARHHMSCRDFGRRRWVLSEKRDGL